LWAWKVVEIMVQRKLNVESKKPEERDDECCPNQNFAFHLSTLPHIFNQNKLQIGDSGCALYFLLKKHFSI
jgi:hypothetical protein